MGIIIEKEIEKIAKDLSISAEQFLKIIISSQSRTNLINYLAEIAEVSPKVVNEAIINSKLGQIDIEKSMEQISAALPKASVKEIWTTIKNTITPEIFIALLSSESGKSPEVIEEFLIRGMFKKIVMKKKIDSKQPAAATVFKNEADYVFKKTTEGLKFAAGKISFIGFAAPERKAQAEKLEIVNQWIEIIDEELKTNPPAMFQDGIKQYYESFLEGPMPENEAKYLSEEVKEKYGTYSAEIIDRYIIEKFGYEDPQKYSKKELKEVAARAKENIRYVITFGIGGNEMRWHALAALYNSDKEFHSKWIPLNFASQIDQIPEDACAENTIQIAYSRSGDTEETKASLEVFGKRFPNTIVYANKGDLKKLGESLGALVLPFPPKIAGRYCGLKTPVNLTPMYILGMDIESYWSVSEKASKVLTPKSKINPAWEIAKFIFREKMITGSKMIYLGHNDPLLKASLDEVDQFIMEGLAKEGNELFSMVGMQYPRNSHYEIEGPLGNPSFWIYWNVIKTSLRVDEEHENMLYSNSTLKEKKELYADEILMTLIAGNLNTFASKAPGIVMLVNEIDLETLALLSKIYEDTVYYLCRLCMVDPFGNPAVKNVRLDSAKNVEKLYELKEKRVKPEDYLFNMINEKYS